MEKAKLLSLDYEIEVGDFKRLMAEQNGVPFQPTPLKQSKKQKLTPPAVGEKRTLSEANKSAKKQ